MFNKFSCDYKQIYEEMHHGSSPPSQRLNNLLGRADVQLREQFKERKLEYKVAIHSNMDDICYGLNVSQKACVANLTSNATMWEVEVMRGL
jgi:hypothetical protein